MAGQREGLIEARAYDRLPKEISVLIRCGVGTPRGETGHNSGTNIGLVERSSLNTSADNWFWLASLDYWGGGLE